MKSVEFCYWLQGLFELGEPVTLDERQTDLIRRHLAMVFKHEIDPSYPQDQQDALLDIHQGVSLSGKEKAVLAQSDAGKKPDGLLRC